MQWPWGKSAARPRERDTLRQFPQELHRSPQSGGEAPYFEGALGVALSNTNGAVVKSDYYVWNWGLNDKGQLGNGSRRTSEEPVQVGDRMLPVAASSVME